MSKVNEVIAVVEDQEEEEVESSGAKFASIAGCAKRLVTLIFSFTKFKVTEDLIKKIDKVTLIATIILFVIFNITFWTYYA